MREKRLPLQRSGGEKNEQLHQSISKDCKSRQNNVKSSTKFEVPLVAELALIEQPADLVPGLEVLLVAELHRRARLRPSLSSFGEPALRRLGRRSAAAAAGRRRLEGGEEEAGAHQWSSSLLEEVVGFGGWKLRIGREPPASGPRPPADGSTRTRRGRMPSGRPERRRFWAYGGSG